MVVTEDMTDRYSDQGFAVARGVVDRRGIERLYRTLVRIFATYRPEAAASLAGGAPWIDPAFHAQLAAFRAASPEAFGTMYDTAQLSTALQQLLGHETLVGIAERLLDAADGLAATGHLLRMDPPRDGRNRLDWHQESSYYRQNASGGHGLVCWVPLHDMDAALGPVVLCPGSHRGGRIEVASSGKSGEGVSEQYIVPADEVARFEECPILARAGDAVFFHMDLFHRSGHNVSSMIRFSAAVRFHVLVADDYMPGRVMWRPSGNAEKALAERGLQWRREPAGVS